MKITQILNVGNRPYRRGAPTKYSDTLVRQVFAHRRLHSVADTAKHFKLPEKVITNMRKRYAGLGLTSTNSIYDEIKLLQPKDEAASPPPEVSAADVLTRLEHKADSARLEHIRLNTLIRELRAELKL